MINTIVRRVTRPLGFDLVRYKPKPLFPQDFDEGSIETIRNVSSYTMTSPERLFALIQAVKYVVDAGIPGAMVECGVWRGGSMMAVAHTLKSIRAHDRELYLFDTYEGMPSPTDADIDFKGESASQEFRRTQTGADSSEWCSASIDDVKRNLLGTGYDADKLVFVKGKVEDTIPGAAPGLISLLRLDTDWYESTRHELVHLYPRLVPGGVLVLDDYGYWQGGRKAVDEYFSQNGITVLLNRADHTGRVAVKR